MHYDHRFEAALPEYRFRDGEQAHVCFDAAATGEAGEEFVFEMKDISTLGFIAACTRLPETGERVTLRLPGLAPVRARTAFAVGRWAGYEFDEELAWDRISRAVRAANAGPLRVIAA